MAGSGAKGRALPRRVQARLDDAVDQARCQWDQRCQQPEPPPHRAALASHHLVAAKPAVPIEWPGHTSTAPTLMQLQAAVAASRILSLIADHRWLVAPRAEAGRNQR
jgi:hypothetical protein